MAKKMVGLATTNATDVATKAYVDAGQYGTTSGVVVLTADVTNSNATANTIATVTGLSVSVVAGSYLFHTTVRYTAAAITTGARWSVIGPSFSALAYSSRYGLTTTTEVVNHGLNAYDLPSTASASTANTDGNIAIVEGLATFTAAGTFAVRFASEIASSAIVAKAGSVLAWQRVA